MKSKVGRGVSDEELATKVATVLDAPAGQRSVSVSVGVREPKLTTEQAAQLGVKQRLVQLHPVLPVRRLPGSRTSARRPAG